MDTVGKCARCAWRPGAAGGRGSLGALAVALEAAEPGALPVGRGRARRRQKQKRTFVPTSHRYRSAARRQNPTRNCPPRWGRWLRHRRQRVARRRTSWLRPPPPPPATTKRRPTHRCHRSPTSSRHSAAAPPSAPDSSALPAAGRDVAVLLGVGAAGLARAGAQGREDPLPRARQRRQDLAALPPQARPHGHARPDAVPDDAGADHRRRALPRL